MTNKNHEMPTMSVYVAMGSALALTALSAVASGQESSSAAANATSSGTALTEIVVTARRVEESAQRVPVAVTAFSAAALEERHIATAQDLQGQVPSLSVTPYSQTRDVELVAVRGQATTFGAPPAVVMYMAEVPLVAGTLTTLQGAPGQFLDLANVQVLRGPQGTLFGRNSTGGAILLEPARPVNALTGSIQLQGGNYGDKEAQAVVNMPLSERLLVRFAAEFVDRDGYTRDIVNGTRYDNRRYWTGRLGITWKPTDSVENYLMVGGTDSRSNGAGWILEGFNSPYINAVFGAYGGCAGLGLGNGCSVLTQMADAQRARGPRETSLGPTSPSLNDKVKGWNLIDQLKVELTNSLTLRNILSYSSLKATGAYDGDGTPLTWYNANLPLNGPSENARQLTEELQLQGNALQNNLTYTAGLYYEGVNTPSDVFLQNYAFLFSNYGIGYRYDNSAKAAYGQLGYDFGHLNSALAGLKLTAGARYTWDYTHGTSSGFNLYQGAPISCSNGVPGVPTSLMDCGRPGTRKSSAPSWTLGLDYLFNEHVLGYAKITHGYKRGGLNLYAVSAGSACLDRFLFGISGSA